MPNRSLYFDDDGKLLHRGNFVEADGSVITMIFEEDGERKLGGRNNPTLPSDAIGKERRCSRVLM